MHTEQASQHKTSQTAVSNHVRTQLGSLNWWSISTLTCIIFLTNTTLYPKGKKQGVNIFLLKGTVADLKTHKAIT